MRISGNCPNCGEKMLEGHMVSGGGRYWLMWYLRNKRPGLKDQIMKNFPFYRRGDLENGLVLHPYTDFLRYLPAYNCPKCQLVLLDYDEKNAID